MSYGRGRSNRGVNLAFGFFMCCFISLFFLGWMGTRIVLSYKYDINCGGHLKRAADSNTIELAGQELDTALKYMEQRGWDKGGSTHLFFATPDCDVGFWHTNLSSAKEELATLSPNTTQLEKTNVLMKLRETILDDSSEGIKVTNPPGISVYPYQWAFFLWAWGSFLVAAIAWVCWFIVLKP
jgi:hypothetical protein